MRKIIIVLILAFAIVQGNSVSAFDRQGRLAAIGKQPMPNDNTNIIQFKVNGQPVQTSGWNIRRFQLKEGSPEWLNIATNMHDEQRTINVNLSGTVAGKYVMDESDPTALSHGAFFPDFIEDVANSYSFIRGEFNITRIDTVKGLVDGSFSGTVRNLHGETLEITDGKIINGLLKPGVLKY